VEALLDHFGVQKDTINQKGEKQPLALASRIEKFEKQMPGHQLVFNALRWLGNVGSHGEGVKWNTMLEAFQLVEYVIDEVILKKGENIKAIAQKIVNNKGAI
jgi:hypothetical protein